MFFGIYLRLHTLFYFINMIQNLFKLSKIFNFMYKKIFHRQADLFCSFTNVVLFKISSF